MPCRFRPHRGPERQRLASRRSSRSSPGRICHRRCGLRCRSHPRNCSRERRPSREITLLNRKLVERMAQSIQLARSARVTSSGFSFWEINEHTREQVPACTGHRHPDLSTPTRPDRAERATASALALVVTSRQRRLRPNTEAVWPARSSFLPGPPTDSKSDHAPLGGRLRQAHRSGRHLIGGWYA
jgi:hypothetical protein